MAKSLGNLIDLVSNLHDQIKADAANFKAATGNKRRESHIQGRIKELEANYIEAKTVNLKIISAKEENNLKEKYYAEEIFINLKEEYLDYLGELSEALNEETKGTASTSIIQDGAPDVRLRRIELPIFAAGYEQWRPFYELYVSLIHDNQSLTDIQKLHYLKSSVQGEAARLLQHVSLEAKNYMSAWTILTERYENKRVLVNTHLRILMNQKQINIETAASIKGILDTTTECIHSLRNIGVPVDQWDMLLIYVLCNKLPSTTQELWEESLQGAKNLVEFTTFTKFLETRFRTLESIEQSKIDIRKAIKPTSSFTQGGFQGQTKAFHTGFESKPFKPQPTSRICVICKEMHNLQHCLQFIKMDVKERFEIVKKKAACINCLSFSHQRNQCSSKFLCRYCNQRHHTLLHSNLSQSLQMNRSQSRGPSQYNNRRPTIAQHLQINQDQRPQTTETHINPIICPQGYPSATQQRFLDTQQIAGPSRITDQGQNIQTLFTQRIKGTKVLLATALLNCQTSTGNNITLRALIDPGSEATFITEAAVQSLKLQKRKTTINIISLGQTKTGTSQGQVSLTISSTYNSKYTLTLNAFVYTNITNILPSERFTSQHWTHLEGIQFADPLFHVPGQIDILLGADAYSEIILSGVKKGPLGSPIAQNTELGWIISGNMFCNQEKTILIHHQLVDLDKQLRRFWEMEELSECRERTEEENLCEEHYKKNHIRLQDGRYQVRLPFKENKRPIFQNSRQTALSRLFQLEHRFKIKPELKEIYKDCLDDYLQLNHMTEIQAPNNERTYYLPHHAVLKESTTTKLRVVFDASCKIKDGTSLNSTLMVGPTIQHELIDIINKWRKFKVAYSADITKMYRQIWIHPQDAAYQLICWRKDDQSIIKTYALNTVTFGTASAPFLAIRTLLQLAEDEKEKFPIASKILMNNFYVDDVMFGADTVEEALESQQQLLNITNSAGFPLRKWASNHEAILKEIPKEFREVTIPLTFDKEDYVKALGFQWYPGPDVFRFKINLPAISKISKRSVLSDIAKLFDPHGWISPCIVYAKLILQELWLQQTGWDDPLPDNLSAQWLKYRSELITLENINIPRWIQTTKNSQDIQLHGFSDASERAYAAVVYVRSTTNGSTHVQLITAKTKIAPLKRISLPRLELCAAVLLSRLLNKVKRSLEFQNFEMFAWTDSMITLAWIKSHPAKWKTFVANRVTEIQTYTSANIWHHVNTKNNPADIASRGIFPSEMEKANMWWHGPPMLKIFSSRQINPTIHLGTDLEMKKLKTMFLKTSDATFKQLIDKYSTLNKLLRVTAYCFRAAYNLKNPTQQVKYPLTVVEIERALYFLIRLVQTEEFEDEKTNLVKKINVSNRSKILMLHPFLDKDNLLRVGGRLQNSNLEFERQHPIIMPRKGNLTSLIIRDAHLRTAHGGVTLTTNYLQNKFWIINAKRNISKIINKCIICFKLQARTSSQLMGNLPAPRVQIARPFYNTGVDYAGPLEIKAWKGRCNKFYKGYIAIFICLCTKAIHIELVSDLGTPAFMAAYHRFTARRGICRHMYSYCGTNFVGANNKLIAERKIISKQWSTEITDLLNSLGTQWHFNPPSAPHFGGLWEAGVKSIKYHLKRITGNAKLTFEEYTTLLAQIEACLNSRPLCPKSPDPDDLSALTPGHFLIMSSIHTPPEPNLSETKLSTLDRWKYIQQLYQLFWSKWSNEYLSRLQQRPKWNTPHTNIKIGDLVIIREQNLPPTHWQLARVIDTHSGKDQLTRVVTLKTTKTTLQRPIHKICLLPIRENSNIQGEHES